MAEFLRPTTSEIEILLKEASDIRRLKTHGLSIDIFQGKSEGSQRLLTLNLSDEATQYKAAEIEISLENGRVVASKATLEKAYTGLNDKQRALIVANIFHYADGTDPLFKFNFADTIDRESEQIEQFKNFIRNKEPRLFIDLRVALEGSGGYRS